MSVRLTEAIVQKLPLDSGIHRDDALKSFFVLCGKTTRSYYIQTDLRRDGQHIKSIRKRIGRCDRISLQEARRKGRDLINRVQSGEDVTAKPGAKNLTLQQVFDRYVRDRELAESTEESYRFYLDKYLSRLAKRRVASITRDEVRALYDRLREQSGQTTASGVMRTLRLLSNEAMRLDETITANPVSVIKIPGSRKREVQELDLPSWWQRTEELAPIRRDYHRFLLFSGLRRRSATTILKADVDTEGQTVLVRQMKSGTEFILPLSTFMTEMLTARIAQDEPLNSKWLFPSPTSKSGHLEEPKEKGLPSPHEYRHLYRTHAIAAGVPYAESALLLQQRLPGASGGYVHPEHLADHLRQYQEKVTRRLLSLVQSTHLTTSVKCE